MSSTQNQRINFHSNKKNVLHRLPFIGDGGQGPGLSFWDIPATGGYSGGCETGKALALIYMKHLREHGPAAGGILQVIAFSMFEDAAENDSRRGQIVGFFTTLEKLWFSACRQNSALDDFKADDLLESANAGLQFDEEAFLESLPEELL